MKNIRNDLPDTFNAADTNSVSPLQLVILLTTLAKTNELYYLHPSFGYYFEQFYLEPHGLVYRLKTLPEDTLVAAAAGQAMKLMRTRPFGRAQKCKRSSH